MSRSKTSKNLDEDDDEDEDEDDVAADGKSTNDINSAKKLFSGLSAASLVEGKVDMSKLDEHNAKVDDDDKDETTLPAVGKFA